MRCRGSFPSLMCGVVQRETYLDDFRLLLFFFFFFFFYFLFLCNVYLYLLGRRLSFDM